MTCLNTEMKKLGRSIQINTQNTRSLIRTPHVCLRHLADGRDLYGERVYTFTHSHTHTQTHTHTHTHTSKQQFKSFEISAEEI